MVTRSTWPPRCRFCCLFIGYDDLGDAIQYTPYGRPQDLEPPDPEFIHRECWEDADDDRCRSVARTAWRAPEEVREYGYPKHLAERLERRGIEVEAL